MGFVLIVVLVAMVVCTLSAVVHAILLPPDLWDRARMFRGVTIVLILVTVGVGGLYYWIRLRPVLLRHVRR